MLCILFVTSFVHNQPIKSSSQINHGIFSKKNFPKEKLAFPLVHHVWGVSVSYGIITGSEHYLKLECLVFEFTDEWQFTVVSPQNCLFATLSWMKKFLNLSVRFVTEWDIQHRISHVLKKLGCIYLCCLRNEVHYKPLYRHLFRRHCNVLLTPSFLGPMIYGRVASAHAIFP